MKIPKSKIRNILPFRMTLSKAQEKELDTLWSKAVKARAGNRCEMCLKTEPLQAHHVIGRRNKTTRHKVSNGCCLCAGHHFYAEQNGVAFAQWIIKSRGEKWWNMLSLEARELKVFKEFNLVKAYLESYL